MTKVASDSKYQGDQGKTRSAPEHRRGTEKSAEDLVGPPEWMESERRSTAAVLGSRQPPRAAVGRRPKGPLRPAMTMYPFPSASYSASESTGGARGLGNCWFISTNTTGTTEAPREPRSATWHTPFLTPYILAHLSYPKTPKLSVCAQRRVPRAATSFPGTRQQSGAGDSPRHDCRLARRAACARESGARTRRNC